MLPFFWIPEENLVERSRRDRVPYEAWLKQGLVTATPGTVIDYEAILERMKELTSKYRIAEVAFDRWGATRISTQLTELGFTMVEFGQGYASMSAPTKELLRLVLAGRIGHGGNPVLRSGIQALSATRHMPTCGPAGRASTRDYRTHTASGFSKRGWTSRLSVCPPRRHSFSKGGNCKSPRSPEPLACRPTSSATWSAPPSPTSSISTWSSCSSRWERAIAHYIRTGDAGAVRELRASNDSDMNIGTPADGGYAVPTGHYQGIIAKRNEGMLASLLGVRRMPGIGTTVNVPYDAGTANVFLNTSEAAGGLLKLWKDKAKSAFAIVYPTTPPTNVEFNGYVTAFSPSAPFDGKLEASVTLKVSGDVTLP